MDTEIIKIDEENIDIGLINKAGQIIRAGGLVAFPTETVYGLGGDALNPDSGRKIYAAKGRPSDNPLIIHIARWEALKEIVDYIPPAAKVLADRFWPGPMTIIMKKSDKVPLEITGGLDTVAVRLPVNKTARALIEAAGGYVAAPSANLSGRPSPTSAKYVIEDMQGRIDMIIDGGESNIGLESTIVDLTEETPMILRPGFITEKQLNEILEEVKTDPAISEKDSTKAPKAPGMKYRHYAPKGSLTIISGGRVQVADYIVRKAVENIELGKRVGIIGTEENIEKYRVALSATDAKISRAGGMPLNISIKSAGFRDDEEQIARSLYNILREFDDEGIEIIFSEDFKDGKSGELGEAIMNRLLKAAGHQVINL